MKRFLRTRTLIGLSLVSVGLALVVPVLRTANDPYGVILRTELSAWPADKPETSPYSQGYHTDFARLNNDIARRSTWAPDDQAWFETLIGDGWPKDFEPPKFADDQAGHEEYGLYDFAMTIAADRIGRSFPIPPGTVDAFETALKADLESPFWTVRHAAVSSVHAAHWVNRPAYRATLEAMAQTDENPRVRRLAIRWLRLADGLPDLPGAAPCPTCSGRGS